MLLSSMLTDVGVQKWVLWELTDGAENGPPRTGPLSLNSGFLTLSSG